VNSSPKPKPPLKLRALKVLRLLHEGRHDEIGSQWYVIEHLRVDGLVLLTPNGLVLSDRAREWIEDL